MLVDSKSETANKDNCTGFRDMAEFNYMGKRVSGGTRVGTNTDQMSYLVFHLTLEFTPECILEERCGTSGFKLGGFPNRPG